MSSDQKINLSKSFVNPDNVMLDANQKAISEYEKTGAIVSSIRVPDQEERSTVNDIKSAIDINNSLGIIKFGTSSQSSLSAFTNKLLSEVKMKDFGETGEAIRAISKEIMSLDEAANPRSFLNSLPIIGRYIKVGKEKFLEKNETAQEAIEGLVQNLVIQNHHLSKDVTNLDTLYNENKKLVRGLELFIYAAEEKLPEIRNELKELLDQAQSTGDVNDAQNYGDFYKAVDRFEKRINNLKRARLVAIQGATQIRLTQESNKMLIEDIIDVIETVIPAWRTQFIQALSIERQTMANEIVQLSKDSSNFMYKKNAENMDSLITAVGKGYERGIYDIEAMKLVNSSTINTLKKTLTIHTDASKARKNSEIELAKMEEELKQALLDASQDIKNSMANGTNITGPY